MKKKINIAVIAARIGSTRIKEKNLLKFKKKYIVNLAINIGLKIKNIDQIILTSDSVKILRLPKISKKLFLIKRSKKLSENNSPMLPVIKDAILKIETKVKVKVDKIIILDPTSILRTVKIVKNAIKKFDELKPDLLVSVNRSDFSPYFDILEKKIMFYDLCKKLSKNINGRQFSKNVYNINTLVWIYSRKAIINEQKRIPKKTIIFDTPVKNSLELNNPEDIVKMKSL